MEVSEEYNIAYKKADLDNLEAYKYEQYIDSFLRTQAAIELFRNI